MSDNQNPNQQQNRSSAPTPVELAAKTTQATTEMNAIIAAATNAAVKEAISGVFSQLGPLLESLAITPEKLREANKPYKDPAVIARELREMLLWKEDEAEARRILAARQDACQHIDDNNRSTIRLDHNWPDRQPRGFCMHCHAYIHPREWRIGAPDAKHPRGVPYLVEPHKNYSTVMLLESHS